MALRVEKAAEKNSEPESNGVDLLDEIQIVKDRLEYVMTWALEGRTYARVLLEHTPGTVKEKMVELADTIKEKAKKNIKEKEYILGRP